MLFICPCRFSFFLFLPVNVHVFGPLATQVLFFSLAFFRVRVSFPIFDLATFFGGKKPQRRPDFYRQSLFLQDILGGPFWVLFHRAQFSTLFHFERSVLFAGAPGIIVRKVPSFRRRNPPLAPPSFLSEWSIFPRKSTNGSSVSLRFSRFSDC